MKLWFWDQTPRKRTRSITLEVADAGVYLKALFFSVCFSQAIAEIYVPGPLFDSSVTIEEYRNLVT